MPCSNDVGCSQLLVQIGTDQDTGWPGGLHVELKLALSLHDMDTGAGQWDTEIKRMLDPHAVEPDECGDVPSLVWAPKDGEAGR